MNNVIWWKELDISFALELLVKIDIARENFVNILAALCARKKLWLLTVLTFQQLFHKLKGKCKWLECDNILHSKAGFNCCIFYYKQASFVLRQHIVFFCTMQSCNNFLQWFSISHAGFIFQDISIRHKRFSFHGLSYSV